MPDSDRLNRWTTEEDAALLDPGKTVRELAAELGRSEAAIKSRRHHKRIRVHRIGPTRLDWLLAKTCPQCGRLLGTGHFHRGPRSWSTRCRDCTRPAVQENQRGRQAETEPTATHHRDRWTGAEIDLLMRDDLSNQQVATMLGRTLYAVMAARKKARHDPQWVESFHP